MKAIPTHSLFMQQLSRRRLLQSIGIAGVALATPSLLAACSTDEEGDSDGSTGAGGGTAAEIDLFTYATSGPPRSLDIATGFDGISIFCTTVGVEALVSYDAVMALQPQLASSWEQPDDTTYVYTIRDGVTFWDGTPLTADDVVASLERNRDPSSEISYYFGSVKSIEATGPLEVTVKLKNLDVFFQYVPALANILPASFIAEHPKDIGTPQVQTMGTGPYSIQEYVADESLTYVRRDDYWGEPPLVKEFAITFIAEDATRSLAMRSGDIDATDVALDQLSQWEEIEGINILSTPSLGTWYLTFDMASEPWSDPHVRRAVAHAFDGEGLSQALFGGTAVFATSLVDPAQWGGLAPASEVEEIYASLTTYPFDLDAAGEELAQSAFPDGFEATIIYPNSEPAYGKALLNLSENLRQIGVNLTVSEVSYNKWIADLYAHEEPTGIKFGGIGPDYPDPGNYPVLAFNSANAVENGFNVANYSNPEVDRLLEEQSTTTDKAVRTEALAQVLRIVSEEIPFYGMFWPPVVVALRDTYTYEGLNAVSVYSSSPAKIAPA